MTTVAKGRLGEDIAVKYLMSINCKIIVRNWRCRRGELDIVCLDPLEIATVVFVEVKLRSTNLFGEPYEAVTKSKTMKIVKAIKVFMLETKYRNHNWRLDIVSINVGENTLKHFRDIKGYQQR